MINCDCVRFIPIFGLELWTKIGQIYMNISVHWQCLLIQGDILARKNKEPLSES